MPTPSIAGSSGQERTPQPARAFGLDLSVPAIPDSLALVRQVVGTAARGAGLDPGGVADLRLALTETCSSAIRRGDEHCAIAVSARSEAGMLRVTVDDDAPAATPAEGGLPLPLVAMIADAIELTRLTDGGTRVAMSFRLSS